MVARLVNRVAQIVAADAWVAVSDQGKMAAMSAVSLTTEAAPASDNRGPALKERPRKFE